MQCLVTGAPERARDAIDNSAFGDRECSQHRQQDAPFGRHNRQIQRHADSEEEQAHEQLAKWFDVAFDLVPIAERLIVSTLLSLIFVSAMFLLMNGVGVAFAAVFGCFISMRDEPRVSREVGG